MSAQIPRRTFVDASTGAVAEVLDAMVGVVLGNGGSLHPGLRIVERDGDMTVLCADADDSAQRLFDVPRELLIPVIDAVWADTTEELRLVDAPPGLTPLQRDVLDLHVALYNASGKIPWFVSSHPRSRGATTAAMVEAVDALRPGFQPGADPIAQAFLSTRVFGLRANPSPDRRGGEGSAGAPHDQPKIRVLMTLIDMLNHHPRGAPYKVGADGMTTAVARSAGTQECFAAYGGRRDVIDLALQYGYVDRHTTIAHCAPLTVAVEGVGQVAIHDHRTRPTARIDAPAVRRSEEGLSVNQVIFDLSHPDRCLVPLRMAVQAVALASGLRRAQASEAADGAVAAIAQRNLELLDAIARSGARTAPHTADAAMPAMVLMADAAQAQADIIRGVMAAV